MAQLNVGGNYLAGLTGGLQAGQAIQGIQDQNALREIGPGLVSGDQNALAQFAEIDPMGAMRLERQRAQDARAEQQFNQTSELNAARLEQIKADAARTAAEEARRLTAEQRAAEAAQIDGALAAASAAYQQGPQAFEAWKNQNAQAIQDSDLDPAQITYDSFPMVAAGLVGAREGLTAGAEFAGDLTGGGDVSAAEEKVRRLMSSGYDRNTAIKIADGAYSVSRNPYTDEVEVIDKGTGMPVAGVAAQPAAPQADQQAPQTAPSAPLSFGQDVPTGGEGAFGLRGAATGAANAITDAVGLGQLFPDAAEQRNFFRNFEEEALVALAQAYPRQPAAALMERLRALAPNVGNLMEGPDQAAGELNVMRRRILRDLQTAENSLNRTGRMRPEDRDALRSEVSGLRSMVGTIDEALTRLGKTPQGQASGNIPATFAEGLGDLPEGITPESIWQEMSPEDRKLWQE